MFSSELEKYSWEDITACIASKRSRDVEIALGKEHLQLDDFMALVSPAAAPYIEHMAALSRLFPIILPSAEMGWYLPQKSINTQHQPVRWA